MFQNRRGILAWKEVSKWKKIVIVVTVIAMFVSLISGTFWYLPTTIKADNTAITKMAYYSVNDGPILSKSGVKEASYGFVMPVFNDGAAKYADVSNDLILEVFVSNEWKDIGTQSEYVYNKNWGIWSDSGFLGYWFTLSKTTKFRISSKANDVHLEYTLNFTKLNTTKITSMQATQGPELTADSTGGVGFTYPTFNQDSSVTYDQISDDLDIYVKNLGDSDTSWVKLFDNAQSGYVYDKNFGQFTDGGGGLWFTISQSIQVKFESKESKIDLIYTLNYPNETRTSYAVSARDQKTTYTADKNGAIGLSLPQIGGTDAKNNDLASFVYEIKVDGNWVTFDDYSKSKLSYSANGYNNVSSDTQWGYWVDSIYGLWFQPIQTDMTIRIGYPKDGQKGDAIDGNYVEYTFVGNPNAPRPTQEDYADIPLGTSDNPNITGMNLLWNDEFNETSLDQSKWSYVTGYYLSDDPGTWGWGNNEMEYYTQDSKNVYLKDGSLHIKAYKEQKSFPQDPSRYAQYSSGKLSTKDKFHFKYGRVDFRAKLPVGNGLWPALWMLPNDNVYGSWASSGEIDVMEARGRLPQNVSGTIHFGGEWPNNTYIGKDYSFADGSSIDSDFHVYSVVWEKEDIKWYVDGTCFQKLTYDQWYSAATSENAYAPFDQDFYLIMNLAVGGWFDNNNLPEDSDLPADMQVDYVRVYSNTGAATDPTTPTNPTTPTEPTTPVVQPVIVGDDTCGFEKTDGTLKFYVNQATFADLHYVLNNQVQQNVAMTLDNAGNYIYTLSNLKQGDTIQYSFTHNPGNGALDTAVNTYTFP